MATPDTTQPVDTTSTVAAQKTPLVSIERVVALLTPVFAGAAGWLFTVITKAIPNINIPHDQFVTVFVAGAVLATTASLTWLFGRQKWTHGTQLTTALSGDVKKVIQEAAPNLPNVRQIQALLEAHEASVIDGVTKLLPASAQAPVEAAVADVMDQPTQEAPTVTGAPQTIVGS